MEVAVLIATYNGAKYLEELFQSLEKQTYKSFVCYVHDDGSKDGTKEIIKKYQNQSGLTVKVLDYPATGSAKANFMSMIQYVSEPYIMFCDQDDIWLENKIELSLKKIRDVEKATRNYPVLVFCDLKVVDEHLHVISDSFMKHTGLNPNRIHPNELLLENVIPGCTCIINKKLYNLALQADDYGLINIHDHFMALLASCSGIIAYIDQPLILYRQHSHNEKGAVKNISVYGRITGNIRRLMQHDYRRGFNEWMLALQKQAGVIAKIDGVKSKERSLCYEFSTIRTKSKLYRVRFYLSNHVLRSKYNMWFLMWC